MKYKDYLFWGDVNIIILSDVENCADIFLMKNHRFPEKHINKIIHIYMVNKYNVVDSVKEERIKIKRELYNIYISNKEEGPKGLIIEKLNSGSVCSYIVIGKDTTSQITLLRSILIKLFFDSKISQGAFPIHCSSICYKDNTYLFIADSNGGKSTIYFTFASYSNCEAYSLMSDDTILCLSENDNIVGYVMPLKPSLRKGTLTYVPPTKCFSSQFNSGYNIDDQIYVDICELKNSNVILQNKIKVAFFINFSDKFSIKKINNCQFLKERIAILICGYKATPIDEQFLNFINNIVKMVEFYDIFIPPNMKDFYEKFTIWLEGQEM